MAQERDQTGSDVVRQLMLMLKRFELNDVVAGLGMFDCSEEGDLITVVEALSRLPADERAPAWDLVVYRYGRHLPLSEAAARAGLDEPRARVILGHFTHLLAEVPPPEHDGLPPR